MREFKVKGAGVYRDDDDASSRAAASKARKTAPVRVDRTAPVIIISSENETSRGQAKKPYPPAVPAAPRRRGERNFLVRYDGHFVGVFEAEEDLTPRQAFILVARDLAAADPAFAPEKLEIFKPVLLKAARPAKGLGAIRGKLSVVGGSLQALTRNP